MYEVQTGAAAFSYTCIICDVDEIAVGGVLM